MQQQQYQMQLQLNGYVQSGYVGPAPAYGGNMSLAGINQGPGFVPFAPSQYAQNVTGSAMYPNRPVNPSMNPPNVLRQPAGPDDLSHGFADLRVRDHRYSAGGPSLQTDASNAARMHGYNQYQNTGAGLHASSAGLLDSTSRTPSAQPGYGATMPPSQTGYNSPSNYGARPTQPQQDSNLWPPLGNASDGTLTPGTSSFVPRKGPQSVWRP